MPSFLYHASYPCGLSEHVEVTGAFLLPRIDRVVDGCCPIHGPDCRRPSMTELLVAPPRATITPGA